MAQVMDRTGILDLVADRWLKSKNVKGLFLDPFIRPTNQSVFVSTLYRDIEHWQENKVAIVVPVDETIGYLVDELESKYSEIKNAQTSSANT